QNAAEAACSEDPTVPPVDEYCRTEREIGVVPTTDFISGTLFNALKPKAEAAVGQVATVDAIEDAPLAVQASPPASGLFSFDKWSSAPILVDALRDDIGRALSIDSTNPDWQRRLFYVPRAHVAKLHCNGGTVAAIEVWINGQQKFLNIAPKCA